jgi:hypothetical protein
MVGHAPVVGVQEVLDDVPQVGVASAAVLHELLALVSGQIVRLGEDRCDEGRALQPRFVHFGPPFDETT